jgi:hypothetical protein
VKITFKQTGGLMGVSKIAEVDYDLSEKEWDELLKNQAVDKAHNAGKKDSLSYFLKKEGDSKETEITIQNIPTKWNPLFDKLYAELKPKKK